MSMSEVRSVEDLMGHTCTSVVADGDEVIFTLEDGRRFKLYHNRCCCESVELEDICGDLNDLVGTRLIYVEEASTGDGEMVQQLIGTPVRDAESQTWTFYKFSTIKGSVTLRWYGTSNGYYSERVDFKQIDAGDRPATVKWCSSCAGDDE